MVTDPSFQDLRLRIINETDKENLRIWKNANKGSFFLKEDISPGQQDAWFEAMQQRSDDFLFIVEQNVEPDWIPIGCMGFRVLENENCVDAYNIIRAIRVGNASFTMGDAFKAMLVFAKDKFADLPLRCRVLHGNPAIKWYEKNGFRTIAENPDHVLMELNEPSLRGIKIVVEK